MAAFDSNGSDKVGKAAVVDLNRPDPAGWEKDGYVPVEDRVDVIIYEMYVRDFTISAIQVFLKRRGVHISALLKKFLIWPIWVSPMSR